VSSCASSALYSLGCLRPQLHPRHDAVRRSNVSVLVRQCRRVAEGDDACWLFGRGCAGAALYVFLYNKYLYIVLVVSLYSDATRMHRRIRVGALITTREKWLRGAWRQVCPAKLPPAETQPEDSRRPSPLPNSTPLHQPMAGTAKRLPEGRSDVEFSKVTVEQYTATYTYSFYIHTAALPSGLGCLCPPTAPWNRAFWSGVTAAYALHCRFVDCLDGIVIACR
jgi:hypothetical protein